MFATIGWFFIGVVLAYATAGCYFLTVPTLGEAMFDEDNSVLEKFIGCVLWAICASCWVWWLSAITINV